MSQKLCALFAAAAGALALGAAASAQLSDPYLLVRATNASGTGTFSVPLVDTSPGPNGSTTFSLGSPEDIFDGPNLIATVTQLTSRTPSPPTLKMANSDWAKDLMARSLVKRQKSAEKNIVEPPSRISRVMPIRRLGRLG